MNKKEKLLLDVLEKTRRIKKDIKNVNELIESNTWLEESIGYRYDNAESQLEKCYNLLEQIKENIDNN